MLMQIKSKKHIVARLFVPCSLVMLFALPALAQVGGSGSPWAGIAAPMPAIMAAKKSVLAMGEIMSRLRFRIKSAGLTRLLRRRPKY